MTTAQPDKGETVSPALSSPCRDCGIETTPCTGRRGCRHKGKWEHYMVLAAVWEAAGMEGVDSVFL